MTSARLCLLAALLGASCSSSRCSAFAPSGSAGVRRPASALRMSSSDGVGGGDLSRRSLFGNAAAFVVTTAAASSIGVGPLPALAAQGPPTQAELNRIKVGYEGVKYLLANFEKETTVCRENGGECKRDADAVRKYLGLRSTTDPLFQIEKVFNKVKYMDIDPDKLDAFFEASENWNSAMNMSNSMAFISQFGEYNPGGGKDEVLKYLNEAEKQVIEAEKSLRIIMDCLDIA